MDGYYREVWGHQPLAQWKAQCRLVLCLHLISSCFLCSFVKKVLLFSTAVCTFTDYTFAHLPIVCRRVLASRVYCRHGCRSLLGVPPPASKEIRITQSPSSYPHSQSSQSSSSSSSTIQILPVLHQKGQNHPNNLLLRQWKPHHSPHVAFESVGLWTWRCGSGAIASKSGILSLNKFQQQRQFVNLGSISRVDIWSIFGQQQQRPVHQYLSPSVDRSHSYLWSRFAVMCRLRLSAAARSTERAWDATNKNHNLHMRSDQLQFKARSKRCCRMSSVATRVWPVNQCVGDKLSLIETRWILRCHLSCTGFTCSCQLCRNIGILKSKVTVQSPYWVLDRFALNNEPSVETSCY